MTRLPSAVRAVAVAAILSCLPGAVLACGAPAPANQGRHADQAALHWADQVCTGVAAGSAKLGAPPALNGSAPAPAKDAMVGFLDRLGSALEGMDHSIREAGAPPVPDGQSTVDKALGTLRDTRGKLAQARTQLAQAKVTDQAGLRQAVSQADRTMSGLSDPDGPIKDLKTSPELRLAFEESPVCRQAYGGKQ
ncbi:hypothetical protein [Amycolatopsis jiangsuensis]|uniref:Secreted protein n=1 Tax=Amycolatopsis jiangsuensis TaxID=1181879 RepID=A0A840J5M0_9PSEU|nr:hypothetical protein [Amycolatopsis jiangsuensis]MBB4688717.1 hypothetical protein [Amycolatopsis jiangsuensis]